MLDRVETTKKALYPELLIKVYKIVHYVIDKYIFSMQYYVSQHFISRHT